jgi:hypothetical protein
LASYLSVLGGVAALIIFLFFYGRRGKQLGQLATITVIITAAAVAMKYDEIIAIFDSVLGSGLSEITVVLLVLVTLAAMVDILIAPAASPYIAGAGGGRPSSK